MGLPEATSVMKITNLHYDSGYFYALFNLNKAVELYGITTEDPVPLINFEKAAKKNPAVTPAKNNTLLIVMCSVLGGVALIGLGLRVGYYFNTQQKKGKKFFKK